MRDAGAFQPAGHLERSGSFAKCEAVTKSKDPIAAAASTYNARNLRTKTSTRGCANSLTCDSHANKLITCQR